MLNRSTRNNVKRHEMTCGYANRVDGINRPTSQPTACVTATDTTLRSAINLDINRVWVVAADEQTVFAVLHMA
jgi:hypothetical protein